MRIALASDLHFEFHKSEPDWLPAIADDCDVIVLAGDIGVGDGATEAVLRISEAHPTSQVVWIAGNHEFYRQNIDKQIDKYKLAFADHPRVHYLENEAITIDGYLFLGCTLWTGFGILGWDKAHDAMQSAKLEIADFSLIKKGADYKKFSPSDASNKFIDSCRWLKRELEKAEPENTVVVTHFPPCGKARNHHFSENSLTAYFQADCQTIIEHYQPAVWCYGHNHYSDQMKIGNTLVVSNQLGYPNEQYTQVYDPGRIIELPWPS